MATYMPLHPEEQNLSLDVSNTSFLLDVDDSGRPLLRPFTWATRTSAWPCSSELRMTKILCEVGRDMIRVLNFEGTGVEARRIESELKAKFAKKEITGKALDEVCSSDTRLQQMGINKYLEDVPRRQLKIVDEETITRHGIPLPLPLRYSECSDSVGFCLMLLFLALLFYAPVWLAHQDFDIPLPHKGAKLHLAARNCDLWFTQTQHDTSPRLRVRYWRTFGSHEARVGDDKEIRVNVTMWSKQNWEYLACSIYAFVPPGFVFDHLQVNMTNIKRSSFAADIALRAQRSEFNLKNTWTNLQAGLVSKSASIFAKLGLVSLRLFNDGDLNLNFKGAFCPLHITSEAPMRVKGRKDVMLLEAPSYKEDPDQFTLGTGEPRQVVDVHSDASITVTVSPHGPHAGRHVQRSLGEMKRYVGFQHRTLHFGNRSGAELQDLNRWLNERPNEAWVVQMQTTRLNLPKGVWTLAVTGSYLAMPLELYSLLSFGMLTPRIKNVDLDVFGVQLLSKLSEDEVQEVMYAKLIEYIKHRKVGEDILKKKEEANRMEVDLDKGEAFSGMDDESHLFFRRPDHSMDVYSVIAKGENSVIQHEKFELHIHARMFVTALVLNLCTSVILAFCILFLIQMAWPVFIRKFQLEQFNLMLTHRMHDHRVEKRRSWRLIVMMRHSPSHGILIRWAKRPRMADFRRLVFFLQARRPRQHQIRLSVPAKDVPFNRFFPDQREFFIGAEHAPGETREALRVGYGYRAKVIAFDKDCVRMEESIWSSPIVLDPPRPFAATPLLLLKHFFPASRVFSSFEMFIKRHLILPRDVQLSMLVQLVQMQNITPALIPDNYYVEILLGTTRLVNDSRVYAKSPLFRLKQRKTMPEMEFEGQLRLNEQGSCVKPLVFSEDPLGNRGGLPGSEYPALVGKSWWVPEDGWSKQDSRFVRSKRSLVDPHEFKLRNHRRLRFKVVNNSDGKVVAEGFRNIQRLMQEDWEHLQPKDGLNKGQLQRRTGVVQTSVRLRKVGEEDEEGQHFARVVFNFALKEPDVAKPSSEPSEIVFGGDVHSSVWQEGAERILHWNRKLVDDCFARASPKANLKQLRVRITLFAFPKAEELEHCSSAKPVELDDVVSDFGNAGSYPWIVSTAGEPAQTAFFQLRIYGFTVDDSGKKSEAVLLGTTYPFLINRTLTLAALEMAYCSFCRLHGLKMEYLSPGPHGLLAMKDVNIGPALVQLSDNCRGPFPFEPMLWNMRAKCNSEGSIMVTTSVAKDLALIGQVRTAQICLSHRLDPTSDYWIKEPLLSNDLDYSYMLMEWILKICDPVLNLIHGFLEKVLRPYRLIKLNKMVRFGFRRFLLKRMVEVVILGVQLSFFAIPSGILLFIAIAITQQQRQFEPLIEPHPARVLAIMDSWFELYSALGQYSRIGYIACGLLLLFFATSSLMFSIFNIKFSTWLPVRFRISDDFSLPGPYLLLDHAIRFIYTLTCLSLLIYLVCCVLWFVLGSVVSPTNLPVGIFVVGGFTIGRTVTMQLWGMRNKLKKIMAELIDDCLRLLLDKFFANHRDAMRKRMFAKDVKKHLKRSFKSLEQKMLAELSGAYQQSNELTAGRRLTVTKSSQSDAEQADDPKELSRRSEEWFAELLKTAEKHVDKESQEMGLPEETQAPAANMASRDLQTDEVYDFEDEELAGRIQRMFDHSLLSAPSSVHLPADLLNPTKLRPKIQEYVERIVDGMISEEKLAGYMNTQRLEIQARAEETFEATFFKDTDLAFLNDRLMKYVNERLPEYTRAATERMLDPADPQSYLAGTLLAIRNQNFQKVDQTEEQLLSPRFSGIPAAGYYDGMSWLADFLTGVGLLRKQNMEWATMKNGSQNLRKIHGPMPLVDWLQAMIKEYCWEAERDPKLIATKLSAVWQIISKVLDGQTLWYAAFEHLICEKFGIRGSTEKGKQKLALRIGESFDQFSACSGFLPATAVVSAVQKVTNRGVWKDALRCLLSDMHLGLSLAGENASHGAEVPDNLVLDKWWNMFERRKKKNEELGGFIRRQAVYKILGLMVLPHLQSEHMEESDDDEDGDVTKAKGQITQDEMNVMGIPEGALWQEAYRDMLRSLGIRVTPETETRVFMKNQTAGYMNRQKFKESINLLAEDGMWLTAFQSFLEDVRITLPPRTVRIIYKMADFQEESVDGVVDCGLLARTLKTVILQQGLWLEAVHVILKEMSVQVSKDDLQDIFDQENNLLIALKADDDQKKLLKGFIPYESILDVANGLGRKGLPLDSFVSLVHELHLSIPDAQLHEIFARMDVNQEFGITWPEFRSGFCLMMKDTLPNNLLDGIGLSERKIMEFVGTTVFSLFTMFIFLQLACATLAQTSNFQTFMQSALTVAAAVAVKVESSVSELAIYKEQVTELISTQLDLPHSIVSQHLKTKERAKAE